jgi:hypothetical protein
MRLVGPVMPRNERGFHPPARHRQRQVFDLGQLEITVMAIRKDLHSLRARLLEAPYGEKNIQEGPDLPSDLLVEAKRGRGSWRSPIHDVA